LHPGQGATAPALFPAGSPIALAQLTGRESAATPIIPPYKTIPLLSFFNSGASYEAVFSSVSPETLIFCSFNFPREKLSHPAAWSVDRAAHPTHAGSSYFSRTLSTRRRPYRNMKSIGRTNIEYLF
jgi:hypothetical protein